MLTTPHKQGDVYGRNTRFNKLISANPIMFSIQNFGGFHIFGPNLKTLVKINQTKSNKQKQTNQDKKIYALQSLRILYCMKSVDV